MLTWTLTFLILSIAAAILGFSQLAGAAAGVAQLLFIVFLLLLGVSAVTRVLHGKAH